LSHLELMWRVALSLPMVGTSPGVRTGQAIHSQNRDGYEVERGVPPQWSWPGKEDTGDVGSQGSRGEYGVGER